MKKKGVFLAKKRMKRKVLIQKPVLIMNSSMEAPIKAEPIAIFTYQSRNFILCAYATRRALLPANCYGARSRPCIAHAEISDSERQTRKKVLGHIGP